MARGTRGDLPPAGRHGTRRAQASSRQRCRCACDVVLGTKSLVARPIRGSAEACCVHVHLQGSRLVGQVWSRGNASLGFHKHTVFRTPPAKSTLVITLTDTRDAGRICVMTTTFYYSRTINIHCKCRLHLTEKLSTPHSNTRVTNKTQILVDAPIPDVPARQNRPWVRD